MAVSLHRRLVVCAQCGKTGMRQTGWHHPYTQPIGCCVKQTETTTFVERPSETNSLSNLLFSLCKTTKQQKKKLKKKEKKS
jgi:hypothetical protein